MRWPPVPAETIAAPAPSPKMKQVLRSAGPRSRDCKSTPTVSTLRAMPERIMPRAIDTA